MFLFSETHLVVPDAARPRLPPGLLPSQRDGERGLGASPPHHGAAGLLSVRAVDYALERVLGGHLSGRNSNF